RGVDEVGYSFGLGEVQPVVEKSALREFTGFCVTYTRVFTRFHTACQNASQHRRPAMTLEFEHVLTRVRMRCLKVQYDACINGAPLGVIESQIMCVTRF